ncbi:hypothetical protein EV361DRAFT_892932 [Lentinula raphanica]|uniref:Uncharacterized protein n=1 Tax=Lentinula raphanica TaxID=153919 RepID=A0AA38P946_9AGAR|nr:hypothetical protein F5880DRAFT_186676 [Lentinula raphanica]KAJ3838609.1 hypothetical protein F5878DRAFT_619090 [Lentinula raphanica]KAJ3974757.1 hypothetical protein EV361DRAFT_892932 [Lentinula raphanica]
MSYGDLLLILALWLSLLESHGVIGANINITVDDSDPSILYQPQTSWVTNSDPEQCTTCLYPESSLAFNHTYHIGFNDVTPDSDDFAHTPTDDDTANDGHRSGKDSDTSEKGDEDHDDEPKSRERMRRLDSDDPGFVDSPVTAQFNFSGTAVYLFCVEPLAPSTSSTPPTTMNLTFLLDGVSSGSFVHTGSSSASGFAPNIPVLSLKDLDDNSHVLIVNILPGSVFVLDYLVYTVAEQGLSPSPTSSTMSPSASTNAKNTDHRNIGTFAGAVGGSVGVLGTLAFCLFLSIWTRRRRSAKRERLEQARERELAASRNIPPIIGPAPFIPRYFPRINPAAPPPYVGPSHNVQDTSFFHTTSPPSPVTESNLPPLYVAPATSSNPLTYADIPPSTPPPPLSGQIASIEAHWIALPPSPPPPFGETIANSASSSDATEIPSPHETNIPSRSPTSAPNSTTVDSASQRDTGADSATEDPGIPTTIAPG